MSKKRISMSWDRNNILTDYYLHQFINVIWKYDALSKEEIIIFDKYVDCGDVSEVAKSLGISKYKANKILHKVFELYEDTIEEISVDGYIDRLGLSYKAGKALLDNGISYIKQLGCILSENKSFKHIKGVGKLINKELVYKTNYYYNICSILKEDLNDIAIKVKYMSQQDKFNEHGNRDYALMMEDFMNNKDISSYDMNVTYILYNVAVCCCNSCYNISNISISKLGLRTRVERSLAYGRITTISQLSRYISKYRGDFSNIGGISERDGKEIIRSLKLAVLR